MRFQTEEMYNPISFYFRNLDAGQKSEILKQYSELSCVPENQVLIYFQTMDSEFFFSTTDYKLHLEPQEEILFKSYFAQ